MVQKINLDILLESIDGIAYRCRNDKYWTMEFITSGIERITGYTQDEILNNAKISFDDITLKEDKLIVRQTVDEALEAHNYYTTEYRVRHKDGRIIYLWEQGVGVYDGDKIIALEGYICDITAQKQTEIELKEKVQQQAMELLREKEKEIERTNYLRILELIKSMAHELRNPLNLSINSTHLLEEEIKKIRPDNTKAQRVLSILEGSNNRINEIVETIELTFRSATHKRGKQELYDLIIESTSHFYKKINKHGIQIEIDEGVKDYMILATKENFIQSLKNIIKNSISAVKKNNDKSRKIIEIYASIDSKNNLRLTIKDFGIGISKEYLDMITLPFTSTTTRSKGSGLGLSAAKYLLQDDNLELSFNSKENAWTEAYISIPENSWAKI